MLVERERRVILGHVAWIVHGQRRAEPDHLSRMDREVVLGVDEPHRPLAVIRRSVPDHRQHRALGGGGVCCFFVCCCCCCFLGRPLQLGTKPLARGREHPQRVQRGVSPELIGEEQDVRHSGQRHSVVGCSGGRLCIYIQFNGSYDIFLL